MLAIPAGAPPAGSGVGELGSSVRVPPFTAKTDRIWLPLPSTDSVLPSGDRRASMSAPPPLIGVLAIRASEPSGLMA
jgi:hypothetical protein